MSHKQEITQSQIHTHMHTHATSYQHKIYLCYHHPLLLPN